MDPGLDAVAKLSDRQKQILRLLLQGHDAKSLAQLLQLSVHTVNEHLRDARRTLGASSSRAAARLLAEAEGRSDPKFIGDEKFGVEQEACDMRRLRPQGERHSLYFFAGGAIMVLLLLAAFGALGGNESGTSTPRVVSVSPRQNEAVKAGTFNLSVSYDQPMLDGSWSFVQVTPQTFPQCSGQPRRGKDGRTFTWRCVAAPGRSYEVWFNRPPYMNFNSASGRPAEPYRLIFTVKGK